MDTIVKGQVDTFTPTNNHSVASSHALGGGLTTMALTVDRRIRTAVLYAPNSGDDADLLARWGQAACRFPPTPGRWPLAPQNISPVY